MPRTYFSEDHEWIDVEGDIGMIGITDHAQDQLGDIVFLELPEVGTSFAKGDELAVVESVKAASEVYAPVSGEVVEINELLKDNPDAVNKDAEGDGWFVKLALGNVTEVGDLMDDDAYKALVDSQN